MAVMAVQTSSSGRSTARSDFSASIDGSSALEESARLGLEGDGVADGVLRWALRSAMTPTTAATRPRGGETIWQRRCTGRCGSIHEAVTQVSNRRRSSMVELQWLGEETLVDGEARWPECSAMMVVVGKSDSGEWGGGRIWTPVLNSDDGDDGARPGWPERREKEKL
ncbi:putative serine/arginine-rich splicing factor SR45 isoform X1 [Iris pallida]|uniref:Serine/arginine-rich splicing factor SR45 isoform X1 n=1 Tax=Iris pallida TaxID=29817 RepID=A0AAX6ICD6_IRIPA|nr:putative serine/arginine-rich splicing factor SR45 isoform X1 [Iris pallida]